MTETIDSLADLGPIIEALSPSTIASALDRERPYDGQPWTDHGERGKTLVSGLTMRDIHDCYIIGAYQSSGLPESEYPESVYELPWDEIDPIAVAQNMVCEIERRMGIFPNIPTTEGASR